MKVYKLDTAGLGIPSGRRAVVEVRFDGFHPVTAEDMRAAVEQMRECVEGEVRRLTVDCYTVEGERA